MNIQRVMEKLIQYDRDHGNGRPVRKVVKEIKEDFLNDIQQVTIRDFGIDLT